MFSAMVKKEFLLVLRDKQALAALFILPAVFILIMSTAMKDQFASDKLTFTIRVEDFDQSTISQRLIQSLAEDTSFQFTFEGETPVFSLIIPKGLKDGENIEIRVQGSIKNNLIEIFKGKLLKHVMQVQISRIAEDLSAFSPQAGAAVRSIKVSPDSTFNVIYNNQKLLPNSTQQSVPAWIVFGMYFVIIPMSTIYINEIKQHTLTRLTSMNSSVFLMSISKSVPYLMINHLQVWVMLSVGMFLTPLLNTPALSIHGSLSALILISFALSVSAIGLSSLIAASSSSSEQATTIGGVLNILLGGIGGVMVPKFIMPEAMQRIAELSPMSWGLDGFLKIFLNSASFGVILPEAGKLILFGIVCLGLSMLVLQKRIQKGL